MNDEHERRLLELLADDGISGPAEDEEALDEVVAEAAELLSDLRSASDDLTGASIWRQVAVDARRAPLWHENRKRR